MPRTRYAGGVPIAAKQLCRIMTGTYTGDGTISQSITGIGFTVKFVYIVPYLETASDDWPIYLRWTTFFGDLSAEHWTNQTNLLASAIISLDSDGFTVDDRGTNQHPNKSDQLYAYVALG